MINQSQRAHAASSPKSHTIQPVPTPAKPVSISKIFAYLDPFKDIQAAPMMRKPALHSHPASTTPQRRHLPQHSKTLLLPQAISRRTSNLMRYNLFLDQLLNDLVHTAKPQPHLTSPSPPNLQTQAQTNYPSEATPSRSSRPISARQCSIVSSIS